MPPETLHDIPRQTEEQAEKMFAEALRRHARKFGGAVCHVSDLAKRLFFAWVRKHHGHERFAERFPIEGPDTARYCLCQMDLDFRRQISTIKLPRRRPARRAA